MNLHIHRFIEMIRVAEGKGQQHIHLSLNDAKNLHTDITKLLLLLQKLQSNQDQSKVEDITVSGGTFKDRK